MYLKIAAAVAASLVSFSAAAQNYPVKPVRVITPWPAGGLTDVAGRIVFAKISESMGNFTPIMRSMACDARTVEILSRTQAPPLRASDVKRVTKNGKQYIVVRRYMLVEVTPKDARAANTNTAALANKWASRVRRVLPQVAPTPSRFGV